MNSLRSTSTPKSGRCFMSHPKKTRLSIHRQLGHRLSGRRIGLDMSQQEVRVEQQTMMMENPNQVLDNKTKAGLTIATTSWSRLMITWQADLQLLVELLTTPVSANHKAVIDLTPGITIRSLRPTLLDSKEATSNKDPCLRATLVDTLSIGNVHVLIQSQVLSQQCSRFLTYSPSIEQSLAFPTEKTLRSEGGRSLQIWPREKRLRKNKKRLPS